MLNLIAVVLFCSIGSFIADGEILSYQEYLHLVRSGRITTEPPPPSSPLTTTTISKTKAVPTNSNSSPFPVNLKMANSMNSVPPVPAFCRESSADAFWTNLYCAVFLLSWLIFMAALAVYTILRSIGTIRGGKIGSRIPPSDVLLEEGIPLRQLNIPSVDEQQPNRADPQQLHRDSTLLHGMFRLGSDSATAEKSEAPIMFGAEHRPVSEGGTSLGGRVP